EDGEKVSFQATLNGAILLTDESDGSLNALFWRTLALQEGEHVGPLLAEKPARELPLRLLCLPVARRTQASAARARTSRAASWLPRRSEEHTSELQSRGQ